MTLYLSEKDVKRYSQEGSFMLIFFFERTGVGDCDLYGKKAGIETEM